MDFQLVIVRGRGANSTVKLGDGVTTVGRQDECQLRIKSSQVSRRHCELFEKKGLLLVKDLGSSNGTYVNGKKIDGQRVLEPGDELMIGQVTFKVSKGETGSKAAAAGPKPGDTAVVPAAVKPVASDTDDFDIEFDDDFETSPSTPAQPAAVAVEAKTPAPAAAAKAATKAEPKPAEPDNAADDAIADFLLDIKFDDE